LKNEQQQNEEVKTQFLNLKEIFLKFSQEQKQTMGDMKNDFLELKEYNRIQIGINSAAF